MIACSGKLASSSVAFSGPGGSANVARSAKKMRDVWRDTPSGAMVHSSDSAVALSPCVSTPSRARHPCPSGFKLLLVLPICFSYSHELLCVNLENKLSGIKFIHVLSLPIFFLRFSLVFIPGGAPTARDILGIRWAESVQLRLRHNEQYGR